MTVFLEIFSKVMYQLLFSLMVNENEVVGLFVPFFF